MNRKYQITTFFAVILLASFLFADVSVAQTPTPVPPASTARNIQFDSADIEAADLTQGNCEGTFRADIIDYGAQINLKITTQFIPSAIRGDFATDPKCHIVAAVGSNDGAAASRLEAAIRSTFAGTKLSSEKAAAAIANYPQAETSWWKRVVNFVLIAIYGVIASVLGGLASLAGEVLNLVISVTTNAAEPKIVGTGWLIIRDFMNLFFIFGLIIIGLATILRIESYNYKKLLVQLILMALLINFSKVIATTIISFFDVITNVVKGDGELFSYIKFMSRITNGGGTMDGLFGGTTSGAVVTAFSGIVVAGIAIIGFIVIAAMYVVRMVALWFLIMVSPVAYALNILPRTKGLAQTWWTHFFKYLIWGPVALLFLRLGNQLIEASADELILNSGDMFDFLFVGVFLWAAIMMVKQSGVYGSAAIMGVANKTISKAKGWNRAAHGAAGSYVARGNALNKNTGLGAVANRLGFTKTADKLDQAGKWTGKKTAQVQAYPQQWKERFAIGNRARDKAIKDEKLMSLATKGKLDKSVYAELGPKHIKAMVDRGIKETEVSDILEHKGRVGADTLMLAFKNNGMIDKYARGEASDEDKNKIKAVTKAFLTQRGVKEYQYEQNQEKFEALVNKAEILGTGDKQKVHIVVPKEKVMDRLTVNDLKNLTPDDIMRQRFDQDRVGASAERLADEVEDAADTIRDASGAARGTRARNNGNSGSPEFSNVPNNPAPTPTPPVTPTPQSNQAPQMSRREFFRRSGGRPSAEGAPANPPTPPVTPPPVQPTPNPAPPTTPRSNNNGNGGSPELS